MVRQPQPYSAGLCSLAKAQTLQGMHQHISTTHEGAAQGGVCWLLRAEGLALLLISGAAYAHWGSLGWGWFAALFLLPDIAFIGYATGARTGALCYNATHATLGPAALLTFALFQGHALCLSLALIWLAHIGFDRALGYGLKYTQGFGWTHLGRIGKQNMGN